VYVLRVVVLLPGSLRVQVVVILKYVSVAWCKLQMKSFKWITIFIILLDTFEKGMLYIFQLSQLFMSFIIHNVCVWFYSGADFSHLKILWG